MQGCKHLQSNGTSILFKKVMLCTTYKVKVSDENRRPKTEVVKTSEIKALFTLVWLIKKETLCRQ